MTRYSCAPHLPVMIREEERAVTVKVLGPVNMRPQPLGHCGYCDAPPEFEIEPGQILGKIQ